MPAVRGSDFAGRRRVDPKKRLVQSFTSPETSTELRSGQMLTEGTVLPGFEVTIDELFSVLSE